MGGKLNGTEINNGGVDVFANWDLWHLGQKGSTGEGGGDITVLFQMGKEKKDC